MVERIKLIPFQPAMYLGTLSGALFVLLPVYMVIAKDYNWETAVLWIFLLVHSVFCFVAAEGNNKKALDRIISMNRGQI